MFNGLSLEVFGVKSVLTHQSTPDLHALLGTFLAIVADDLVKAQALQAELLFNLEEPRTFQELRELAHRQAGNAATFGFEDLGDAARAVDRCLSEGCENAGTLLPLIKIWLDLLSSVSVR
jgi:hypothetical protein